MLSQVIDEVHGRALLDPAALYRHPRVWNRRLWIGFQLLPDELAVAVLKFSNLFGRKYSKLVVLGLFNRLLDLQEQFQHLLHPGRLLAFINKEQFAQVMSIWVLATCIQRSLPSTCTPISSTWTTASVWIKYSMACSSTGVSASATCSQVSISVPSLNGLVYSSSAGFMPVQLQKIHNKSIPYSSTKVPSIFVNGIEADLGYIRKAGAIRETQPDISNMPILIVVITSLLGEKR